MSEPPRWAGRALQVVAVVSLLLLVLQYLTGMWTNLYTTTAFTSNSSSSSLDAHYNGGFVLGLLGIVAIALAAVTRRGRLIGQSAALFVWVLLAGLAGMAFVGTTPNPPFDSFLMSVAFLLAIGTAAGLVVSTHRAMSAPRAPPSPVAPTAAG